MRSVFVALMVLLSRASVATAETADAALTGRVTDATGGAIVGARIEIVGPTGAHRRATTDTQGIYTFRQVAPGHYALTATKSRFSVYHNPDLTIEPAQTTTFDVQLALAPVEEKVVVEEREPPLGTNPERSSGAIILRGEDLEALPEDPDELAEALQALAGPAAGPNGGQIFIDGFSGGRLPPRSSIREIRLNANPFSAEFDRLGYGRIEIFTKPGTEVMHGRASFNFNNDALNSRNPYASNEPPYERQEWGGNLSGPIVSKRVSFFVDFDRRSINDNELVNATILDSSLNLVRFSQMVETPRYRTTVSPRIDWQIGPSHTLTARYTFTRSEQDKAGVGEYSLPSRAYDTSSSQQTFQLSETSVLSKSATNQTRIQYIRERRNQQGDDSVPTIQVLDSFTGGGSQIGTAYNHQDRLEIQNVTSWVRGRHSVRAGVRVRGVWIDDLSSQNFGGTVTFAGAEGPQLDATGQIVRDAQGNPVMVALTSIERYQRTLWFARLGLTPSEIRALGGGASQYRIAGGDPEAIVAQWDVAPFVQDDWRVSSHLTLSVGLRYEAQTHIESRWNVAPRLGFAWSPGSKERPTTVIRGGFGLFYDRFGEDYSLQAERYDGVSQQQYLVTDPAVLDTIGYQNDQIVSLPSVVDLRAYALPQTTRRIADDLQAPYTIQTSLSVEQQLPAAFTFSATAVMARARRQLRSRNVNAPLPGTGEHPLGDDTTVYQWESTGRLHQDQVILGINNRSSRSLTLFVRYFYGRARSDTDGAGSFPGDSYDLAAEWGRAAIDVRHRFTLGGSLALPWGIRVSPMVIASSGRPFNITTGRDNNGDTVYTDRPAYATDPSKPGVVATSYGLLDPDPAPAQPVIPRNLGRGPGFFVINLRFAKTIGLGPKLAGDAPRSPRGEGRGGRGGGPGGPMGGLGGPMGGRGDGPGDPSERSGRKYNVVLSVQAQNLFNNVNPAPPVGNLNSPFFGQSIQTAGGFGFGPQGGGSSAGNRRIELQLRASF